MILPQYSYETASPDWYPILKEYARTNRVCQTPEEYYLWQHIRKSQLGVKFRRQHPINDFIVDFICIDQRLIIEIDGDYHDKQEQRQLDIQRSAILNNLGYRILRFPNDQVRNKIEEVLNKIKESFIL